MSNASPGGTISTFLDELANSRLFTDDRLVEVRREALAAGSISPREFAQRLIQRGWLTEVQAERLLEAKPKSGSDPNEQEEAFRQIVKESGEIGVSLTTNLDADDSPRPTGADAEEFRRVVAQSGEIGVPLVAKPGAEIVDENSNIRQLNELVKESEEAPVPVIRARQRGQRAPIMLITWIVIGITLVAIFIVRPSGTGVDKFGIVNLDWPAAERVGGSVEIDGEPDVLPKEGALRLHAGKRKLHFERPGYEPIEITLDIGHDEVKDVKLHWKEAKSSTGP